VKNHFAHRPIPLVKDGPPNAGWREKQTLRKVAPSKVRKPPPLALPTASPLEGIFFFFPRASYRVEQRRTHE